MFGYDLFFAAVAASLKETWRCILKTRDGNEFPLTYNFRTDSGKLTGSATSAEGKRDITDGKISGDAFSFAVTVNDEMKISRKGKCYAQRHSASLNLDMGRQAFHTTLKRAADK